MLTLSRWKIIAVTLSVIFGLVFSLPNVLPQSTLDALPVLIVSVSSSCTPFARAELVPSLSTRWTSPSTRAATILPNCVWAAALKVKRVARTAQKTKRRADIFI